MTLEGGGIPSEQAMGHHGGLYQAPTQHDWDQLLSNRETLHREVVRGERTKISAYEMLDEHLASLEEPTGLEE